MLSDKEKEKDFFKKVESIQARVVAAEVGNTSVVVAYYLFLSLFPLLIAVGNILPFLQINVDSLLPYVEDALPAPIYEFLAPVIKEVLTQTSGSLLSISVVTALWSASRGVNALQNAMNKAYGVEARGNFIIVRILSFLAIILFLIGIIGVFLIIGLGQVILEQLQPIFNFSTDWLAYFSAIKWPTTLLVLLVIMGLIYWVTPNAKVHVRSIIPGTLFATLGWSALSQGFSLYAKYFAARINGYQIMGSFIVLMLWLKFAAVIIILGGILNAVVEEKISGQIVAERSSVLQGKVDSVKDFLKTKRK